MRYVLLSTIFGLFEKKNSLFYDIIAEEFEILPQLCIDSNNCLFFLLLGEVIYDQNSLRNNLSNH
jgi:hypothetical protein